MEKSDRNGVTLVVGADSDIGAKLIETISTDVIAHYYLSKEKAEATASNRDNLWSVYGDLSSVPGITEFIQGVVAIDRHISRIVHLPSSPAKPNRITKFDPNRYLREINIQVVSAAMILQAFLPAMVKDNFGRIAMVLTSYCIGVPPKYLSEYVSAKYALMGLMKSLAVEYAGKGITINAVAPSMTETNFLSTLPEFEIESTAKAHPMGRIATPEDIVGILGMLLKQDIEYMTGTIIPITGGTAFF
ncbi:MAG: SDR family oxidoreductase [Oscillospiraceae bacterium]|nr:SDR family oxidoreductase [Oscillospiraceae bacterium]